MKTIFVVDDNDTSLTIAKKALEDQYRVLTMSSSERCFKLLEKIVPDLIILDILMPDMNGFETLNILKANPLYANIPIIFLTSYSNEDIKAKGYEMGVVDYISKPFSEPELLNSIKTHLDKETIG